MINTSERPGVFSLLSRDFLPEGTPGSLHCRTYTVGEESKNPKRNPNFLARESKERGPCVLNTVENVESGFLLFSSLSA